MEGLTVEVKVQTRAEVCKDDTTLNYKYLSCDEIFLESNEVAVDKGDFKDIGAGGDVGAEAGRPASAETRGEMI